jgi:hypothetical protein
MKKTLSLTNKDGEVRVLTADDLRMFNPDFPLEKSKV